MDLTLVLSVGFDPLLLINRNLVLAIRGVHRGPSLLTQSGSGLLQDFRLRPCDPLPIHSNKGQGPPDLLDSSLRLAYTVISVADNPSDRDGFADAAVCRDPEVLLMGLSGALDQAANAAASTPASGRKHDVPVLPPKVFAHAQSENPSKSSAGHERQLKTMLDVRSLYCM